MKKTARSAVDFLRSEVPEWVKEGIVSEGQSVKILSRYEESTSKSRAIPAGFITVLLIIGAVLIGAGIILYFASNWQVIPAAVKITAILAMIIGAYSSGFYFHFFRTDREKLGIAMVLLGCLFYGAGIFLIGQIFHIDAHWPDAFLFWFLGIIPMAWLLKSRVILGAAMLPFLVWLFSEFVGFQEVNFLYPVLLAVTVFPLVYRLRTKLLLFISLSAAFLWTMMWITRLFINMDLQSWDYMALEYMIACIVLAAGLFHGNLKKFFIFENTWKIFSYINISLVLYLFSFNDLYRTDTSQWFHNWPLNLTLWALFVTGILSSLAYLFIGFRNKPVKDNHDRTHVAEGILCLILPFFLLFLFINHYIIAANLLLLLLSIGLAYLGYLKQSKGYTNTGFVLFSAVLITRYVDIGFRFMDRAVFFIVLGIIILGGALLLAKLRRKLITNAGENKNA